MLVISGASFSYSLSLKITRCDEAKGDRLLRRRRHLDTFIDSNRKLKWNRCSTLCPFLFQYPGIRKAVLKKKKPNLKNKQCKIDI